MWSWKVSYFLRYQAANALWRHIYCYITKMLILWSLKLTYIAFLMFFGLLYFLDIEREINVDFRKQHYQISRILILYQYLSHRISLLFSPTAYSSRLQYCCFSQHVALYEKAKVQENKNATFDGKKPIWFYDNKAIRQRKIDQVRNCKRVIVQYCFYYSITSKTLPFSKLYWRCINSQKYS